MRALISLLVVVLVVFALSKLLVGSGPGNYNEESSSHSQSGNRTSDFVRDSVNQSTSAYQRALEQSMEEAGVSRDSAQ